MSQFRKIFTLFCQLPLIIVPIVLLTAVARHTAGWNIAGTYFFVRTLVITLCITFSIGALIKFIYYKERPQPKKFTNWLQKIDASSFPSIHTAYATVFLSMWLVLSKSLSGFAADILIIISIAFYILIARSRIVLKKHFFIDTVFGTAVGLIGVIFSFTHMDAIMAGFHLIFGL